MCGRKVVVTGLGIVSPLGTGVKHAWKALINGKSAVKKLNTSEYKNLPCRVAALVPKGNGPGEINLNTIFSKSELRSMCVATAYALVAAEEALSDAEWKPINEEDKRNTGVAVGIGMIDLIDVCSTYETLNKSYSKVSPYFIPRILTNMAAGQISIKYGFRGPNHAVSTACATGVHAIGDAFRFIKGGVANVMVCGGAEACISPLAIAAFCRLRALNTMKNDTPEEASRPFDKDRNGFVMGEGYGLSGDATHLTSPSDDGVGAILAMDRAIKDAAIDLRDISYINAHATSTLLGDAIELKAIETLFGVHSENVVVSSTKGAHGHLLGSAGNLETVFTILAINNSLIPPTINLNNLDYLGKLQIIANKAKKWSVSSKKVALKNAFGFGGTNASLCLAEFVT
ncbi:3-oxoacyl-[acyl-carrier-protein] synthase, mitochondrial isoform X2 [Chelonus insularis]|uniref:3-oxoacyl-[acyl-carrier-protein] synthase, mitochondrial isoform X2 n=1 Tax=Chelonus insularis TaxID=460826 RepID=UPI00158A4F31|nr:3-oxoacyl-[acyl-carrier-protein] synthase, mitochondrial isoform X2 [Chelonus insularis]